MPKRVSERAANLAAHLYARGFSRREIGEQLGYHGNTFYAYVSREDRAEFKAQVLEEVAGELEAIRRERE